MILEGKIMRTVYEYENYACASRFTLTIQILWLWCHSEFYSKFILPYITTHDYAWTTYDYGVRVVLIEK